MPAISILKLSILLPPQVPFSSPRLTLFPATPSNFNSFSSLSTTRKNLSCSRSSKEEEEPHVPKPEDQEAQIEEDINPHDEWLQKLPDKNKPLYSHSLPCLEAWLKNLGFFQSRDDRALWLVQKTDWHAQLSLDLTDLYIR